MQEKCVRQKNKKLTDNKCIGIISVKIVEQLNDATREVDNHKEAGISSLETVVANTQKNSTSTQEAAASVPEEAKSIEQMSESGYQVAALADKLTAVCFFCLCPFTNYNQIYYNKKYCINVFEVKR